MTKLKYSITALLFVMLCIPFGALADGAFIPPPSKYVQESGQEAVITHKNGTEELILSVEFEGDADEFVWIVPTPSKPEIDRSSDELFTALDEYTGYSGYDYGLGGIEEPLAFKSESDTVTVVESKKVDIYDTVVLEARNSKDLAKWLNDNGYVFPEKEAYIFDYYLDKDWYFAAAKINTDLLDTSATESIKTGHSTPLKLTFETDKLVYPLKISSIQYKPDKGELEKRGTGEPLSALEEEYDDGDKASTSLSIDPYYYQYDEAQYVPISLYVFAEGKKSIPGFSTSYANYVGSDVIKDFAYVDGEPWLETEDKMYLTKLYRNMPVTEMTDDLYLRDAKEKEPIGGATQGEMFLGISLAVVVTILATLFSPCGLLYIIGALLHIGKKRGTHIAGWIMQWVGFVAIFVGETILVGYLIIQDDELTKDTFYNLTAAAITLGVLILVMAVIMIWQKVRISKRNKKGALESKE